jgi:uncharacterized membrane protein YvbJ
MPTLNICRKCGKSNISKTDFCDNCIIDTDDENSNSGRFSNIDYNEVPQYELEWKKVYNWGYFPAFVVFPYFFFGMMSGIVRQKHNIINLNLVAFFVIILGLYFIGLSVSVNSNSFAGFSHKQWKIIPPILIIIGALVGYFYVEAG